MNISHFTPCKAPAPQPHLLIYPSSLPTTQPQPERDDPLPAAVIGTDTLPHADIIILGGGVAGLWTGTMLAKKGYSVLLIEKEALGAGQTIASQGILHGGIKYTLGGKATEAARAVAAMPARWHAAMTNTPDADFDLRALRTLCPAQYLWTTNSFFSRATAKVAATAIRTAVRPVQPAEACEGLRSAENVDIHRVDEPVIDPRSLLLALHQQFIAAGGVAIQDISDFSIERNTNIARFWKRTVRFSTVIFAAGSGNRVLLTPFGSAAPSMQKRRSTW
ncbi:MAG: FAD-binding oxidoreductase [Phycisphaerales bacterium]